MRLMLLTALAITTAATHASANAGQGQVRAVLELFTSQGCSSCPPADALLKSYARSDDVMALTMPVTVWDHIGWKDTLANESNTRRQQGYARAFGQSGVYTPEMVINGASHAVGSSRSQIDRAIESDAGSLSERRVPVRLTRGAGGLVIDLGGAPAGRGAEPATVWLGRVVKSVPVVIKNGENAGRTVTYTNVVQSLVTAGTWDGQAKQLPVDAKSAIYGEGEALFVLVQHGAHGPILGADWLGTPKATN